MKPKISSEKEARIRQMLLEGATYKDMVQQCEVATGTINKVKKRMEVKCKKCGLVPPIGSKFCNHCGSKILTEAQELAQNLKNCTSLLYGTMHADDIMSAILAAAKYLEGVEQ